MTMGVGGMHTETRAHDDGIMLHSLKHEPKTEKDRVPVPLLSSNAEGAGAETPKLPPMAVGMQTIAKRHHAS